MDKNEHIKKYFSELAKRSHKKNPRSSEFYKAMARKRWEKKAVDKQP